MRRVEIIESDSKYDFEKEINNRMREFIIEDIKFCVDSMFGGRTYHAMIIYE